MPVNTMKVGSLVSFGRAYIGIVTNIRPRKRGGHHHMGEIVTVHWMSGIVQEVSEVHLKVISL